MLVLLAGPGSRYYASTVGEIYNGLTPTIYAAPADVGTGDGSSEANAMALIDVCGIVEAGDIVGLIPANGASSYFFTSANTNAVYFQTASSGTSGSPIVFVTKYPALDYPSNPELWSELRATSPVFSTTDFTAYNANRPAIGSDDSGSNHVHWIGPYMDMAQTSTRPTHGPCYAGLGTTGIRFQRFRYRLVETMDDDNFNMVSLRGGTDSVVSHCVFTDGAGTAAQNHNMAAITTYGAINFLIERNSFIDGHTGVFVKGTTPGPVFNYGTIRLNLFEDMWLSGVEFCDLDVDQQTLCEQNLFVRVGAGTDDGQICAIALDNSSSNANHLRIVQNTFVDCGQGETGGMVIHIRQEAGDGTVSSGYYDLIVRDNVFYFGASATHRRVYIFGNFAEATSASQTASTYNLVYNAATPAGTVTYEDDGVAYSTLALWQAHGKDANSTAGDPGFTSPAADDYHRPGADTGSSTGGRRGVYITNSELIGAE